MQEATDSNKHTKGLTKVQAIAIVTVIVATMVVLSTLITYGSDSRPSEALFENSQTVVLH